MDNNGINDLISKYFEGVSTDSEKEELILTLSGGAEHRRLFMREAMLRAEIQEWASQKMHQLQVRKRKVLKLTAKQRVIPADDQRLKSLSNPHHSHAIA